MADSTKGFVAVAGREIIHLREPSLLLTFTTPPLFRCAAMIGLTRTIRPTP